MDSIAEDERCSCGCGLGAAEAKADRQLIPVTPTEARAWGLIVFCRHCYRRLHGSRFNGRACWHHDTDVDGHWPSTACPARWRWGGGVTKA